MKTKDKKLIYSVVFGVVLIIAFLFVFQLFINKEQEYIYVTLYNPINNEKTIVKTSAGNNIDKNLKEVEVNGYEFLGWFYDSNLTVKVNKGDIFNNSRILKAGFSKIIEKNDDDDLINIDYSNIKNITLKTSEDSILTAKDIRYINSYNPRYLDLSRADIENKEISKELFYFQTSLTSISLPRNCEIINEGAFKNCYNLRNIKFNESIRSIEKEAFCNCKKIEAFEIVDSVETIKENIFIGCDNLKKLKIGRGLSYIESKALYSIKLEEIDIDYNNKNYLIKDNVLYTADYSKLLYVPNYFTGVLNIHENTLEVCDYASYGSKITTINIPASLQSIGVCSFENSAELTDLNFTNTNNLIIKDSAFENCSKLEDINFPVGLASIGNRSFKGCEKISTIIFNSTTAQNISNLKKIGYSAFKDCTSLKEITIPDTVNFIDSEIFSGCSSLQEINLSASITIIPDKAFYNNLKLTNINIASKIETIGDYAFYNCREVEEILGLEEVENLGVGSFYNCKKIIEVSFDNVMTLPTNCFYNCTDLKNVSFDNVVTIGESSFYNCLGLESIIIPETVQNIHETSFDKCLNITEFISNNTKFTNNADGVLYQENAIVCYPIAKKDKTFTIKDNIINILDKGIYLNKNLESIEVESTDVFESIEGVLFEKSEEGLILIRYPASKQEISYTVPSNVIQIDSYAFSYNLNLERLIIPENVLVIKDNILLKAESIKSLTTPFIGYKKELEQGENADKNKFIGYFFGSNNYMTNDYYVPDSLEKVIVTNEERISKFCFYQLSTIKFVEFNKESTTIEEYAFYCCESLEEIVFNGAISNVGKYAIYGLGSLKKMSFYFNETLNLEKDSVGEIEYSFIEMHIYEVPEIFETRLISKFQNIYYRSRYWNWQIHNTK